MTDDRCWPIRVDSGDGESWLRIVNRYDGYCKQYQNSKGKWLIIRY